MKFVSYHVLLELDTIPTPLVLNLKIVISFSSGKAICRNINVLALISPYQLSPLFVGNINGCCS